MGYNTKFLTGDTVTLTSRGRGATRATAVLPATTTAAIFTVAGVCLLTQLYGVVTTVIQTQACNVKVAFDAVAAGANLDLCADLNVSAKAVGTILGISGVLADALLSGVAIVGQTTPIILQPGSIVLTTSATNTGSVRWGCRFLPLEIGSSIIAA